MDLDNITDIEVLKNTLKKYMVQMKKMHIQMMAQIIFLKKGFGIMLLKMKQA